MLKQQVNPLVMNFGIKISHYDMLSTNLIHICNIIDAINSGLANI